MISELAYIARENQRLEALERAARAERLRRPRAPRVHATIRRPIRRLRPAAAL